MANLQLSSVQLVHIGPGQGFFPFGAVPRGIPKSEILRINVRSRLCPKFQIWGRTSLDSCLWRKLMTLCYAMAVSFSGDRSAVIHRNFVIHNLHSTLPLIVIVLSRIDKGHTVSDGDAVLEKGAGCCTCFVIWKPELNYLNFIQQWKNTS